MKMMMQIVNSLWLMLGMLSAVSSTQVAVRSTFESSYPDVCTDDEFNIALSNYSRRRNLRSESHRRLSPWYCSTVCRDFPKGTWYVSRRDGDTVTGTTLDLGRYCFSFFSQIRLITANWHTHYVWDFADWTTK
jgi:hypothetical protein